MEFRLNNGLLVEKTGFRSEECWVGDVMIPRQIGRLTSLPDGSSFKSKLVPISAVGSIYKGFDLNSINTAVRLIYETPAGFGDLEGVLGEEAVRASNAIVYE
jgi:hypothetical protein